MKPNKLIMTAFLSYAKETEINFDDLGNSGLFLITGDTGAGKTSIFDGIVYALYGEASGSVREADTSLRSDFAKPSDITSVKLWFTHRGEKYFIERRPEQLIEKKNGEGLTKKSSLAEIKDKDGNLLASKSKDVTKKVSDILGVNSKQFKQICMIAQGEFLKLLLADSTQRGEIFRKIFGTEKFEQFQKLLKEREKSADEIILLHKNNIFGDFSRLKIDDSQTEIKELIEEKNILDTDKITELLEEYIKKASEELKTFEDEFQKNKDKKESLIKEIEKTKHINSDIESLNVLKNEKEVLYVKKQEIEELSENIEKIEKAETLKPDYLKIKDKETEIENLEKELNLNFEKEQSYEKQFSLYSKIYADEEGRKDERDKLAVDINLIETSYPKYEELNTLNKQIEVLKESIEKANSDFEKCNVAFEKNTEGIKKARLYKEAHKDDAVMLEKATSKKENLIKEKQRLSELKEKLKNKNELKEKLLLLEKEYIKLEETYKRTNNLYNESYRIFLREQAGILAKDLEEGMACPVCGSLSHPNLAKISYNSITEEELNTLKSESEKAGDNLSEKSKQISVCKTDFEIKSEEIETSYFDILENNLENLSFEFLNKKSEKIDEEILKTSAIEETLKKNIDILSKADEKIALYEKNIEKAEEYKEKLRTFLTDREKKYSSVNASIEEIKKTLSFADKEEAEKECTKKKNILDNMNRTLKDALDNKNNAELNLGNIKILIKDQTLRKESGISLLSALKEEFSEKIIKNGFKNIDILKGYFVDKEVFENMKNEKEEYYNKLTYIDGSIKTLEEKTKGYIYVDVSDMENKLELFDKNEKEQNEKIKELSSSITSNSDIIKRIKKEYLKYNDDLQKYTEIKMLSDAANGRLKGVGKLAFEQYVQGAYFRNIIYFANKRFIKMTDGKYELCHKETFDSANKKTGLEIEIFDNHTGKKRDVKSLSGGESFKAALSLALGMSDVIESYSGGISTDILFLDEGFGSLDTESRETAIRTLTELTDNNRLVGIISHVDELKERIEKQIRVKKTESGSTLKMVKSI